MGSPCRTWTDRLNRLPLLMSSLVLSQESLRRSSRNLLTICFFARATPPAPRKAASSGLSPVHQKRLSVHQRRWPVHPSLSPTMFEVVPGDFRWHLRSKHRGPRGRSGDIWAEHLLRWLGEGGATGRRRSRSRSSIFKGDAVEHLSVTLDSPHDCGVFRLRNVLLALIVEGGSAEVA